MATRSREMRKSDGKFNFWEDQEKKKEQKTLKNWKEEKNGQNN